MELIITNGTLGGDATVKAIGDRFVLNFSLAVNRYVKGENQTHWYKVAYWSNSDKMGGVLTKGSKVIVTGQPDIETYTAKDGTTKCNILINASKVDLVSSKADGASPAPQAAAPVAQESDEDLPF